MIAACQAFCIVGLIFDVYLFSKWGPTCPLTSRDTVSGVETDSSNTAIIRDAQISFQVYTLSQTYVPVDDNTNWTSLDCGQVLIVIFHGSGENSSIQWIQNMQQVYIETYGFCSMTVDYTYTAFSSISLVLRRGDVNVIGSRTAQFYLNVCIPGGVSLSSTHFIGYSLGSHVAGVSASQVTEMSGEQIAQVTGLDPEELFRTKDPSERMSPSDADCVVAYHTSCRIPEGIYASRNYWWGQCGSNQYPVCHGDCRCDKSSSHDYFIFALQNQTYYQAYNCTTCPYSTPQDEASVIYGEDTYCNNVTQFVLSNPNACESGDLYVLPEGCVPSNK